MDVITMPPLTSLVAKLSADYPELSFVSSAEFSWSPSNKSVYYTSKSPSSASLLLHELSHALLGHDSYDKDISLIAMERDAWEKASDLAVDYGVTINEDTVQDHLDSYREWMHARSRCPSCDAIGVQNGKNTYHCVACRADWTVNEARLCGLKRYKITPN
jgi:hypothetical protein